MINNTNRNSNTRTGTCRNSTCRNNNRGEQNCRSLMNQLRAVDFALTETVLYLDAYPDCNEAMCFYRKLVAQREQLVAAYEAQCGPLTMYGNSGNTWDWAQGPWPWEAEANG